MHVIETMDQSRLLSDNKICIYESLAGRMIVNRMTKKCLQMYSEREIVAKMSRAMIESMKAMLSEDAKRRARESRKNLEDITVARRTTD